jgi:hypothetical protein
MNLSPPSTPAPGPAPGFLAVLRGIWLLTWRAQWNWRRMAGHAAALLVLPALVYQTTWSTAEWGRRPSGFGSASGQIESFARRLAGKNLALDARQSAELTRIVTEEYARSAADLQEQTGESVEARSQRLRELVDAGRERIIAQAQSLLDGKQMAEFQEFLKRNNRATLARLTASSPSWGRTGPFYHWLIDFYFFIILPLACVRGCGALIRDELQADTLGFLLTRPISRARLLLAKFLAQTAWLEIILLLETLLLFAAGGLRQVPALGVLLPLLLAAQVLAVPAWCALGVMLGQITSRYIATAMIYGAVVEMGIGRIPTNINTLSLMRHLKILLSQNAALQAVYDWQPGGRIMAVAALVLAPVVFFGVAAVLFSWIEYHHAAEMQK